MQPIHGYWKEKNCDFKRHFDINISSILIILVIYYLKKPIKNLRVEGFLFLYNKQQEQQKQETSVIIIIAADAPTNTPIKTVKLKYNDIKK